VKAIPALKAAAQKYAAQGFLLIAPSLDAEEKVKQFKEKQKIEEYILVADSRATATSFGVESYPMMFLIGKDGKVAWKGEFENAALHQAIEAALAAKAPDAKAKPAKK